MNTLLAQVEMLIRRPPADVFAALTDGVQITSFWLAHTSGPLVEGQTVHWEFKVKGAVDEPLVTRLMPNHICLTWTDGSTTDWHLTEHPQGTVLKVESQGFTGDPDDYIASVIDNTQGYTIVSCDLKTYLEQGHSLNLSQDKATLISESLRECSLDS